MPPAVAAPSGTSSSTGGAAGRREDATHTRLIANASDASTLWTSLATDGSANVPITAAEAAEAVRRRRRALPSGPDAIGNALTRRLIRDLIRYLYLVLDMSSAALQPPDHLTGSGSAAPTAKTRHAVLLATAIAYVREYYDQNPISHLGIVLLKDGQAQLVSPLGGSPGAHLGALQGPALGPGGCGGNASLMNGLECAGRSLSAAPAHGSREVLVLSCSLRSDDPGDLMGAAEGAASIGVRVSAVGLAGAEVYAVRRICEITGGSHAVASDGGHLRRLVRGHCVPPISVVSDNEKESDDGDNHDKQNHNRRQNGSTDKRKGKRSCAYVKMGFPTRETTAVVVEGKNGSEGTDVAVPTLVHSGGDRKVRTLVAHWSTPPRLRRLMCVVRRPAAPPPRSSHGRATRVPSARPRCWSSRQTVRCVDSNWCWRRTSRGRSITYFRSLPSPRWKLLRRMRRHLCPPLRRLFPASERRQGKQTRYQSSPARYSYRRATPLTTRAALDVSARSSASDRRSHTKGKK